MHLERYTKGYRYSPSLTEPCQSSYILEKVQLNLAFITLIFSILNHVHISWFLNYICHVTLLHSLLAEDSLWCYSMKLPQRSSYKSKLSVHCTYLNLELSLGVQRLLTAVWEREQFGLKTRALLEFQKKKKRERKIKETRTRARNFLFSEELKKRHRSLQMMTLRFSKKNSSKCLQPWRIMKVSFKFWNVY